MSPSVVFFGWSYVGVFGLSSFVVVFLVILLGFCDGG